MLFSYNLDLGKFGVDIEKLIEPSNTRYFQAWLEDWEITVQQDKNIVAEKTILTKYTGLHLVDP